MIISPQADACLNVLGIVTKKQALPHNIIDLADIDLSPKLLVKSSLLVFLIRALCVSLYPLEVN
jgi:hypothetical protein